MKRFIALVLILIIALASCAKSAGEDAAGDAPVSSDPMEKVYAFLGTDKVADPERALESYEKYQKGELFVAFCSLDFAQNIIQEFADGLVNFWLGHG